MGVAREGRTDKAQIAAGWSGVQSVPCELSLLPDGHLAMQPIPELQSLRADHLHLDDIQLSEDIRLDIRGSALEIRAEFEPGEVGELEIVLAASEDGSERTSITYNAQAGQLVVNRQHSSQDIAADRWANMASHVLASDEKLDLHVFLDGSVIEIFANNRTRLASRIYPSNTDSQGVAVVSRQNDGRLHSLDIWKLRSIWSA